MAGVEGVDVFVDDTDDVALKLESTSTVDVGSAIFKLTLEAMLVPAIDEQSYRLTKPSAMKFFFSLLKSKQSQVEDDSQPFLIATLFYEAISSKFYGNIVRQRKSSLVFLITRFNRIVFWPIHEMQ